MKWKWVWILAVVFSCSCNKEYSCEECQPQEGLTNAMILYTGPVAGDGCDWVVKVGDLFYHPDNLPDSFKEDGLEVNVRFIKTTDKFYCGFGTVGMDVIHLVRIQR